MLGCARAPPRSAAVRRLISLVLAFLIPISVAYRSLLMPDWIVSSAGSGISTCWNQPFSSSRFTRMPPSCFSTSMMMVACGMPSSSARIDAGLSVPEIVGLQAGEDQVGRFGFQRRGQQLRGRQRIVCAEVVLFDMDGAVGALGERFANGLRGARRSGAQRDDFAAVLLLQLQTGLQRICVRLVDLVGEIGILNPLPRRRDRSWESRAGTCLIVTTIFIEPVWAAMNADERR